AYDGAFRRQFCRPKADSVNSLKRFSLPKVKICRVRNESEWKNSSRRPERAHLRVRGTSIGACWQPEDSNCGPSAPRNARKEQIKKTACFYDPLDVHANFTSKSSVEKRI